MGEQLDAPFVCTLWNQISTCKSGSSSNELKHRPLHKRLIAVRAVKHYALQTSERTFTSGPTLSTFAQYRRASSASVEAALVMLPLMHRDSV